MAPRTSTLPALGAPFTYTIDDATGNQVGTYTTPVYTGARPNPNFGAIYEVTNGVSSWYDALGGYLRQALLARLPVAGLLHLVP